jgi:hypothetical protein
LRRDPSGRFALRDRLAGTSIGALGRLRYLTGKLGLMTRVATDLLGQLSEFIAARRDVAEASERDRGDRIQLRLAILASVVVAPSPVTGFYGANLALQPDGDWDGGFAFLLILAVFMMLATLGAVVWISRASGRAGARARRSSAAAEPEDERGST